VGGTVGNNEGIVGVSNPFPVGLIVGNIVGGTVGAIVG
jgi:hypothetical protein